MNSKSIQHGPFAGTVIPSEELEPVLTASGGMQTDRNGQPRYFWPAQCRTPLVLEKFSPAEGYGIEVTSCEAPYRLTDKFFDVNGNPVVQPSRLVTAKLSRNGVTLACATILQPIFGSWAMALGEQVARGALYDALGLGIPSLAYPLDSDKTDAPQVQVQAPAASIEPEPAPEPQQPDPVTVTTTAPVPEAAAPTLVRQPAGRPRPSDINGHIEKNLLQTIETQAAAKGVPVPSFADLAAAKGFLQDLLRGNTRAPAAQAEQGS
jgi:hypothetical protein